jgi:hypothetical protein
MGCFPIRSAKISGIVTQRSAVYSPPMSWYLSSSFLRASEFGIFTFVAFRGEPRHP